MAANLTDYCLEKVTDYFQFERLCSALMSLEGYGSIEPLGGSQDKGRDAIYVDESNQTTIFAYSVNKGWRVKLTKVWTILRIKVCESRKAGILS